MRDMKCKCHSYTLTKQSIGHSFVNADLKFFSIHLLLFFCLRGVLRKEHTYVHVILLQPQTKAHPPPLPENSTIIDELHMHVTFYCMHLCEQSSIIHDQGIH